MRIAILVIGLFVSVTSFAHDAIYCKKADGSIFSWLNFDGNGNPLVTATIRVKDQRFNADITPGHYPQRRQSKPLSVAMGPYTLTLGLEEKLALLTMAGKQNGATKAPGANDELLTCCNPNTDFSNCEADPQE